VFDLTFTVDNKGAATPLTMPIDQVVVAGWTGRDPVARDKHIAELEALGIARPASTPIYYRCSARRLTMEDSIEVCGTDSSGEVEFFLVGWQGRMFVGLGSDHTDRKVESYSITVSKQMCDKPIAPVFWPYDEVAPHWDRLILRSHSSEAGKRVLYQEGTVAAMIAPLDLVRRHAADGRLAEATMMFCGTLAARGGVRATPEFSFELEDPVRGRKIAHSYRVRTLPILG
jgi:hypothetical protein